MCVGSMCILNNFTAPAHPKVNELRMRLSFSMIFWLFIQFLVFYFCFIVPPSLQTLFEISLRHFSSCSLSLKVFHNL